VASSKPDNVPVSLTKAPVTGIGPVLGSTSPEEVVASLKTVLMVTEGSPELVFLSDSFFYIWDLLS